MCEQSPLSHVNWNSPGTHIVIQLFILLPLFLVCMFVCCMRVCTAFVDIVAAASDVVQFRSMCTRSFCRSFSFSTFSIIDIKTTMRYGNANYNSHPFNHSLFFSSLFQSVFLLLRALAVSVNDELFRILWLVFFSTSFFHPSLFIFCFARFHFDVVVGVGGS